MLRAETNGELVGSPQLCGAVWSLELLYLSEYSTEPEEEGRGNTGRKCRVSGCMKTDHSRSAHLFVW